MKKLIMFSLLVTVLTVSAKANHFTNQETVYITAPSGLTLREAPNVNSRILEVIPFGESVNVIIEDDEFEKTQRIDWIDGQWIKVEFEGLSGFVFDGFVSSLPVPLHEFELVDSDLNFTYAFQSWMDYRFTEVVAPDTILKENEFIRVVHHFENDQILIEKDEATFFMVDATLSDVRLTDVYHLLIGMMPSQVNRQYVSEQSIFIEDKGGELKQIKLLLSNPVKITKLDSGQINIKLYSNYTGCSL